MREIQRMTFKTPLEEIFWREVFLRCADKGVLARLYGI